MIKEELKQEIEKKKEYLKSYLPLKNRADRLEEEIKEFKSAKILPSTVIDGMPHGNSHTDLSTYIVKMDEKINELIKLRYRKINKYMEITKKIELLEDETEKDLLTLKYLKGMTWDKVCLELSYEWAQVHRIHKQALQHFKM